MYSHCRLLQQGSIYPSSGPLHAGEKNVVLGRDNCKHYSLLPTPVSMGREHGGSLEWFSLRNVKCWNRGDFLASFSAMELIQRAQFTPHCFTEVGKYREACQGGQERSQVLALSD